MHNMKCKWYFFPLVSFFVFLSAIHVDESKPFMLFWILSISIMLLHNANDKSKCQPRLQYYAKCKTSVGPAFTRNYHHRHLSQHMHERVLHFYVCVSFIFHLKASQKSPRLFFWTTSRKPVA